MEILLYDIMKPDIDLVNRLLQESFGDGFKGNYEIKGNLFRPTISASSKLNTIARKRFDLAGILVFYEIAGFFQDGDGSVIFIQSHDYHKYGNKVKKYIELYKKNTGKEAYPVIKSETRSNEII